MECSGPTQLTRGYGATVARLTPDQKVACSNHVGLISFLFLFFSLSANLKKIKPLIFEWHILGIKKRGVPGWARTTNLSVNSRTR